MIEANGCRLYLITPPALQPAAFADTLASALDAGDVAAVQLRLKDIADDDLRHAIDVLRPVVQSRGVAFLLNDRPDLAVAHGCDGAHVGQQDTPALVARKLLGELTLGMTCRASRDLAFAAGEDGADYVAFGALLPDRHQAGADPRRAGILRWWSESRRVAVRRDRRHHRGQLFFRWCRPARIFLPWSTRCGAIPRGLPPACGR